MNIEQLKNIIEAALLASAVPLKVDKLRELFTEDEEVEDEDISAALDVLAKDCESRGIELKEVRSGFRLQVKQQYTDWVSKLWQERPSKYSRALLETLALVAYKQPITRGEVEQVRGVSVSSHIMKTLLERNWVKVVGHRDVPGKPGLYATTKEFLDYFNLKNLSELPPLSEIRDIDSINAELELQAPVESESNTENIDVNDVSSDGHNTDDQDNTIELSVALADSESTEDNDDSDTNIEIESNSNSEMNSDSDTDSSKEVLEV